ncbi:protein kinase domain-containing protein [Zavarzinella formosa]|uniref:protein kinase domain-containing protein n=1 Tax=Zavarzinella formosa TaxID=360055 RepID=UPI00031FD520|nr:protein kinase [Zavarzinella formosa]
MNEQTIFLDALEIDDIRKRAEYLDSACAHDNPLRERIEKLLAAHARSGDFIDIPAFEQIAGVSPASDSVDPGKTEHRPLVSDHGPAQGGGEGVYDDWNGILGRLEPTKEPGSLGRLGHYQIRERIGSGGFGVVLKAFDEKLHRIVAIKVMSPNLATTSPPRQRFLREARAAAKIRHENVVAVYAVEESPLPYLVMEYLPGGTLQDMVDRTGPLGPDEVRRIGGQIAAGLAAAHLQDLIHRDIKPGNILLEGFSGDRVKISDFGLARAVDDASLTQSGVICGTPMYMAPEQASGGHVDQRADLFSLGSVIYLMCTGRPPFRAPTTLAILKRVVDDHPRPVRDIIPEVPAWLGSLIAKLHKKRPEDRKITATEVAKALGNGEFKTNDLENMTGKSASSPDAEDRIVGEASPGHDSPPLTSVAGKPSVSRKWRWSVSIVTLALLVATLVVIDLGGMRGMLMRLFTPEGTLVIESDDPEVSFVINGQNIVIRGEGEIRLRPGQYQIDANKEGKIVQQELVTIAKNERQVVRISRESRATIPSPEKKAVSPPAPPVINDSFPINSTWVEHELVLTVIMRNGGNFRAKFEYPGTELLINGTVNGNNINCLEKDIVTIKGDPGGDKIGVISPTGQKIHFIYKKDGKITGESNLKRLSFPRPPDLIDDAEWERKTIGLPSAKLMEAVTQRLTQLNPGFDREIEYEVMDGVVIELKMQVEFVADISPIRVLTGLQKVALHGRHGIFQDITPLKGMKLTWLSIEESRIADISALKGMSLKYLNCHHNKILDLSPLKESKLEFLNCEYNPLEDLTSLKGMPLKSLELRSTRASDLEPLRGAPLELLVICDSRITKLDALRYMPLKKLDCAGAKVSDLTPLKDCPKLEWLSCVFTDIEDLSPIGKLPLKNFNCSVSRVTDLSPLKNSTNLEVLYCTHLPVSDFTPLAGLKIKELHCQGCNKIKYAQIKSLPLESIECDLNPDQDVKALGQIKTLRLINGQPAENILK